MDSAFFTKNRRQLAKRLGSGLVVLTAHNMLQESADTSFTFRQESNFWYLTGIDEPDLLLVIDVESGESSIVLPKRNEYQNDWDGAHYNGHFQAISGIKNYIDLTQFKELVVRAVKAGKKIHYNAPPPKVRIEPYGFYANPARKNLQKLLRRIAPKAKLADTRMEIAKLRMIKQPAEIAVIQQAVDITGRSLAEAKKRLNECKSEQDLNRIITAAFYANGGDGHGYEPIVASGANAATIHARASASPLVKNELLLLDVGTRVGYYSADISRTWIVGTPTKRQQELFDACLQLEMRAMDMLKPGVKIREYQQAMDDEAQRVFKRLKCSMAGQRFPHMFSHHLGLDIHDSADYGAPLEENMILTVEPGIYLPDEGIGMRVEDNIRITKNGIENLSAAIPNTL